MKKIISVLTIITMCFIFVFGYNKGYFGVETTRISGLLQEMTLDELVETSNLVVQGKLVDISSPYEIETSSGQRSIFTDYIVETYKTLRGSDTSDKIKIRMQGGQIGNREVIVEENPIMSIGDEAIFFLWQPNIGGGFNTAESDYYYLNNNHYGVFYETAEKTNFKNEVGNLIDISTFADVLSEVAPVNPYIHKEKFVDALQSNLEEGMITQEEYNNMVERMNDYAQVVD